MNKQEKTLNDEVQHAAEEFVQTFCSEKQKLPASRIMNETCGNQIEKLKKIGIPSKGRSIDKVVNEMIEDIYKYDKELIEVLNRYLS